MKIIFILSFLTFFSCLKDQESQRDMSSELKVQSQTKSKQLPSKRINSFSSKKWIVYYGARLPLDLVKDIDLAVLDPDQIDPRLFPKPRATMIAYLSVGEAETYRSYWSQIKGKDFILHENPNWKNNFYIDIRSEAWQSVLKKNLIPQIIKKGYDGLFLDTIDTAAYLESLDPKKYKGSKKAMITFVESLKKEFPDIQIYPNNGLEYLKVYGDSIDGVFVEDLYTYYDFKEKKSEKTKKEILYAKEIKLDAFIKEFKKPVFNILYSKNFKSSLAFWAISRSQEKSYHWYLTTIDLQDIGMLADF